MNVTESLKSRNLKVADMGKILGKSRQSVYNYIDAYNEGKLESVPDFLIKLFSMCESTEVPQEQVDAFWLGYTKKITDIMEELDDLRYHFDECCRQLDLMDSGGEVYIDGEKNQEKVRVVILSSKAQLENAIDKFENDLKNERSELLNRPMSDFAAGVSTRVGKLSTPQWQGENVGTVCVANSGSYMIIVNPDSNPGAIETKLKLFTTVNETQVHLKTMDFERGSNMIQFSLIPQIMYKYEVIQITDTEVRSSGVLDLKNYI